MRYHLIGIAGSSMSGLAEILKSQGHLVSGCDLKEAKFKDKKIKTFLGHSVEHITDNLDCIVISAAITKNSKAWEEVEEAKRKGIPIISRAKLIGRLMSQPNIIGIAVAGTHGKTTTSAMIVSILEKAKKRPSFLIGSSIPGLGNGRWTGSNYFVVEACEYQKQFLEFRPKVILITNIETEHLDTYPGGYEEIKRAFKKFVRLLPKNGLLILWNEDKATPWLKKCSPAKVKTFSLKKPWPGLRLKVPGEHNILNATAAARLCHELGIPHQVIKEALNEFKGTARRFEIKGEKNGILIIDDYAHHPTEIKKTLKTAKELFKEKRLICVFQAHQYLRTKALLKDFSTAFFLSDKLIITKIFGVPGRDELSAITNEDFFNAIKSQKNDAIYLENYSDIVKYLIREAKKGDVIITMGATEIYKVGEELLKQWTKQKLPKN